MFRGERPARGRYRQFYQAGCEHYGDPGPLGDAEMIDFIATFLPRVGITEFALHINSLGSAGTRASYRARLLEYFEPLQGWLTEQNAGRTCGW